MGHTKTQANHRWHRRPSWGRNLVSSKPCSPCSSPPRTPRPPRPPPPPPSVAGSLEGGSSAAQVRRRQQRQQRQRRRQQLQPSAEVSWEEDFFARFTSPLRTTFLFDTK